MELIEKIKNLLQYTATSGTSYNGRAFDGSYHTLTVLGNVFKGQRLPSFRLQDIDYDFTSKTVLDIGSNQGGMLYEIQPKIKQGIGIDFDHRLVNVSNKIASVEKYHNLDFYCFDLSKEDFNLLHNFADNKYDVIFLLSVCMWIKNWKELIEWVYNNSNHCLFETNGKSHVQEEQINFLKKLYKQVEIIHESSDDDIGQKKRKTVWCSK